MTQNYDGLFNTIQEKLHCYRPRTADLLVSMKDICSSETAYYAGFIFIYLGVWAEDPDRKPVQALSRSDLGDFTFFEAVQENEQALDLFDELLLCYQAEEDQSQTH